ncbi:hypothetical protein RIF29_21167 [Crotalaria pallida]|uniref:Major facilitator superfamily (MFS) profile domain-containing protein n=1 Tax=Crotalaria pallida TaxID=3830 RepID=A0AAN9F6V0_CROPI
MLSVVKILNNANRQDRYYLSIAKTRAPLDCHKKNKKQVALWYLRNFNLHIRNRCGEKSLVMLFRWKLISSCIFSMAYCLYAYNFPYLQSSTLSGITWYNLSSVQIGLVTSGSLYGALIGSLLAFNVADFLGRKRELIAAASVYLVGALVTTVDPDFPLLVVGRVVFGLGIGLLMLYLELQEEY